jgi:uridine kinase
LTIEAAIAQIERCLQPSLIAIDGLPCSGKSTMAEGLAQRFEAECIHIDEFVLPERDWPSKSRPAFPFQYMRYETFLRAIEPLATVGECSFYPFDWNCLTISESVRAVTLTKPVVIEGVSSLSSTLCPHYDLRIFVESDRNSTLQTAIDRGVGAWETEWRELFLPSVDLYMLTEPQKRADLLVSGRGA